MARWSGIAGGVLVRAGLGVAHIQRLFRLQAGARGLTDAEHDRLAPVFGGGLDYDRVRIVAGPAGVFGLGNRRPFALGNHVFFKDTDPVAHPATLVHECVHVWQFQHSGSGYAIDALIAQRRDGYDWRREVATGRSRWSALNPEAQAQLVEDAWRCGLRFEASGARVGGGVFFDDRAGGTPRFVVDGVDHTALATDAAATLRNA